jgi:hypothetical protein
MQKFQHPFDPSSPFNQLINQLVKISQIKMLSSKKRLFTKNTPKKIPKSKNSLFYRTVRRSGGTSMTEILAEF